MHDAVMTLTTLRVYYWHIQYIKLVRSKGRLAGSSNIFSLLVIAAGTACLVRSPSVRFFFFFDMRRY